MMMMKLMMMVLTNHFQTLPTTMTRPRMVLTILWQVNSVLIFLSKVRNIYSIPDENSAEMGIFGKELPTPDAEELPLEIEETTKYGGQFGKILISGHVILNQCGILLKNNKYQLNGSSRHTLFLQGICATSSENSIPLMYPEGIISPSIFWKTSPGHFLLLEVYQLNYYHN